jgi:hypothetical protein
MNGSSFYAVYVDLGTSKNKSHLAREGRPVFYRRPYARPLRSLRAEPGARQGSVGLAPRVLGPAP